MQNKFIVFTGLGFEMVGLVLGSMWLGSMIDAYYHLPGLGTAGLIILTMVGWIYHLVFMLNRMMKEMNQAEDSSDH